MKNFLLCAAVLFLSACIPAGDFGAYWDKGIIDPALLGKWNDKDDGFLIADKGGVYQIDSLDGEDRKEKGYAPMMARTLKADGYTFLMASMKEGGREELVLVRYKNEGGIIRRYSLDPKRMGAFLREKYPKAKNIKKPGCGGKCWYEPDVRIGKLDDEVYKILSEIPDTKEFWIPDGEYRRRVDFNN